jgi:hypothetical protein
MAPSACDPVFILTVKITIDPSNRDAFLEHFKPVYDKVLAEPECAFFVFGESAAECGAFQWTEGWLKDPEWFMTVCLLQSTSVRFETIICCPYWPRSQLYIDQV